MLKGKGSNKVSHNSIKALPNVKRFTLPGQKNQQNKLYNISQKQINPHTNPTKPQIDKKIIK